jgi:hypothetical protein
VTSPSDGTACAFCSRTYPTNEPGWVSAVAALMGNLSTQGRILSSPGPRPVRAKPTSGDLRHLLGHLGQWACPDCSKVAQVMIS